MYIKKLEHFQQKFKQDSSYSAVIVRTIKSLPVGTPCIVGLNVPNRKKSTDKKYIGYIGDGDIKVKNYPKRESVFTNVLFLFNTHSGSPDAITCGEIKSPKICYTDDKPLIYDSYSSTFLESSKDDIIDDSIFYQLKEQLNDNRFVNYVFEDVKSSNVNNVTSNINKIVKALVENYKNTISVYYYSFNDSRVLIDTVSLSFYKLKDVIPVFNYRKSEGICMEITMTNSDIKSEHIMRDGYCMTYRFLFAKHKENIFYIDGEFIERPNDVSVQNALSSSYKLLTKSVPVDIDKRSLKSTAANKHVKSKKANQLTELQVSIDEL